MIGRIFAALILLNGSVAQAQSTPEISATDAKLCIINVGLKFPNIVGMTINNSRATLSSDKNKSIEYLVSNLPDIKKSALELNNQFYFMDIDLLKEVLDRDVTVDELQKPVAEALGNTLSGAAHIEIDVRALGQDATFGWICVWKGGSYFVVPAGIK